MDVHTGLESLIEKKITWNIDHFNYFGGDYERFMNQEFIVHVDRVGDIPRTKWKFDILCTTTHDQDRYGSRTNTHKSLVFSYTPLNSYITRISKVGLGSTYHIVKASIFSSSGYTKWKSFQTELKDLMDPKLDGKVIAIAMLCKDSSFSEIPVQANGSLKIEISIDICRKRCFDEEKEDPTRLKVDELPIIPPKEKPLGVSEFLKSEEHSDVKIIAKDGKELHAHKIILRARCEVFHAMFRTDMVESQTGVVKLDDISSEGVNFLLHYLYNHDILPFTVNGIEVEGKSGDGDEAAADPIDVEEVLYIASKYRLDAVKGYVDTKLRGLCKEENALYLLGVCKKYSLKCLDVVKAFIKSRDRIIDELMLKHNE